MSAVSHAKQSATGWKHVMLEYRQKTSNILITTSHSWNGKIIVDLAFWIINALFNYKMAPANIHDCHEHHGRWSKQSEEGYVRRSHTS